MKKIVGISSECVACGYCMKICPMSAISVPKGIRAEIDEGKCIGCGKCAKDCPAQVIRIVERGTSHVKAKKWYDYLWIFSIVYLCLGFLNILFAWIGLICFITPILISVIKGNKAYCNKYCGRGQLFEMIGGQIYGVFMFAIEIII